MSGKLTPQLAERVRAADPQERLPVIVRLRPGADPADLERVGFEAEFRVETIESVTGFLRAGAMEQLAALEQVVQIESTEGRARTQA